MKQLKFKAINKKTGKILFGTAGKDNGLVFVKPIDIYADEREEMGYRDKDLEILQFTGIKDVTGKEIYEGDFVSDEIIDNIQVFYNESTAGFDPLNKMDLSKIKITKSLS